MRLIFLLSSVVYDSYFLNLLWSRYMPASFAFLKSRSEGSKHPSRTSGTH